MCGICGRAGRPTDPSRLATAMEALEHRGPDDRGMWCSERVALGHRRLSIIDLSSDGRQPIANEDGSIQVVFNGEIYNYRGLREELMGRHRFRSRSDTEVLVHGYEQWGIEGLLERISGMFALAIWDGDRQVLHLARDHLGKKPLFYALDPGGLAFASTLPSLLELLNERPEVRPEAIQDFLLYLCVPGGSSMFRGVQKLPPGSRAEFRGGSLRVHRYWRPSFAHQERRPAEEWLERIDRELRRAVQQRLISDVPVGVFLSGGVDSSLVAAIAAQETAGPITTISAGFQDVKFDELGHARRVAQHLGSDHHEHVIHPDVAGMLPWLVYAAGEPFGDQAVLPTMLLSQAARRQVSVVLTGDGGDECFAGYPWVLAAHVAGPYQRWVPQVLRRELIPSTLERVEARGGGVGAVARRLRRMAVPARSGTELAWVFDPLGERGFRARLDHLLTDTFADRLAERQPDSYWQQVFAESDGPTDTDRVLQTDLVTLLPDMLLVKGDVATMAYGLEARSPLLDRAIVELSARIPAAQKLARLETKSLLKRLATRYVPRDVIYRRKQGFAVPTGAWLREELSEAVRAVLLSEAALGRGILVPQRVRELVAEHQEGRAEHGQRLWLLLMLELWMRMFVDGTLSRHDDLPRS